MIAISHLFEKKTHYEPFMTGVAKQVGGHGYPTAQFRMAMQPPSVQAAEAEAEEALMRAEKIERIRALRRSKNPTAAERAQGAI